MIEGLELRRAGPADAALVAALTREAYAKWVPVLGREPQPMTVDYDDAVQRHRIDLLYAEGELVGLIELVLQDDHLLIENVAVRTACQGRGLGKQLSIHAETIAASAGAQRIKLYTNKLMTENIQLYGGLGYRIDGEVPFPGGLPINMSKPAKTP